MRKSLNSIKEVKSALSSGKSVYYKSGLYKVQSYSNGDLRVINGISHLVEDIEIENISDCYAF